MFGKFRTTDRFTGQKALKTLLKSQFQKKNTRVLAVLGASILLFSCTAQVTSSRPAHSVNLKAFDTFYVVKSQSDRRGVHGIIVGELQRRGKQTTWGPGSSIPENVDAVVVYRENWVWDMGWYLFNLSIQLRDPKTNVLLASAMSNRPSVVRTPSDVMAREVLDSIFK